jgi:hypothetical protein
MPTLPPVAGTQNAVIHSASGGPSVADVGFTISIPAMVAGGVVTNGQTTFPFTQDTYYDAFMQPAADACYGFGMEFSFDWEAHKKNANPNAPVVNPLGTSFNTYQPAVMMEAGVASIIHPYDRRGFEHDADEAIGYIVTDLSGTLERQKLRKDKIKLLYRRYEAI